MSSTLCSLRALSKTMAKSFLYFILISSCLFHLLMTRHICNGENSSVPAMYVFGDSLSDVGNNNYLNFTDLKFNRAPYGVDYTTHKPTGRCTNGKNIIDLTAVALNISSPSPYLAIRESSNRSAFLKGVNFASAGAGILDQTNEGHAIPFNKQIFYYSTVYAGLVEQLGQEKALAHLNKSLVVITIGDNDIISYQQDPKVKQKNTPLKLVDSLITSLQSQIKLIYGYGARRFVFIGAVPVGCIPLLRLGHVAQGCDTESNEMAFMYNKRAIALLQELKALLHGMTYTFFNDYTALLDYTNKPASYGFTEVKAACCGPGRLNAEGDCDSRSTYCSNRTNHVFWDKLHPTSAAYELLTKLMLDGNMTYVLPVTVRELISI